MSTFMQVMEGKRGKVSLDGVRVARSGKLFYRMDGKVVSAKLKGAGGRVHATIAWTGGYDWSVCVERRGRWGARRKELVIDVCTCAGMGWVREGMGGAWIGVRGGVGEGVGHRGVCGGAGGVSRKKSRRLSPAG